MSKNKSDNHFSYDYLRSMVGTLLLTLGMGSTAVAYAEGISVTTTEDEDGNNPNACSLREAVDFINRDFKGADGGCARDDDNPNSTIILETDETYLLTKGEIAIKRAMYITNTDFGGINQEFSDNQPLIVADQGQRALVIDDLTTFATPIDVKIADVGIYGYNYDRDAQELKIQTSAVQQGGLIFNRESLILEYVKLYGGYARQGGAIYNSSSDASLRLSSSDLQYNQSQLQGAAIYSELPAYAVTKSSFISNISEELDDYVIYTAQSLPVNLIDINKGLDESRRQKVAELPVSASITNSIFTRNKSSVSNVLPYMHLNNLTILDNRGGISLNAQIINPYDYQLISSRVANSVVLGNQTYDLRRLENDNTYLNHVVYHSARGVSLDTNYISHLNRLTNAKINPLFAVQTTDQGTSSGLVCQAPSLDESSALFCPLLRLEDVFMPVIRPRLLMKYTSVDDSPIVNQGATAGDATLGRYDLTCEKQDIRGSKNSFTNDTQRKICDIGAFELIVNVDNAITKNLNPKTIEFGDNAILELKNVLGDGQLVPAASCPDNVLSPPTDPEAWPDKVVGNWIDGCLLFINGQRPQKGKLSLNDERTALIYEPDYHFHGYDEFEYQVVTTTTRFSDAINDRSVQIYSLVNQAPKDDFVSKTQDLGPGSGAWGFSWLYALLTLILGRSAWLYRSKS